MSEERIIELIRERRAKTAQWVKDNPDSWFSRLVIAADELWKERQEQDA